MWTFKNIYEASSLQYYALIAWAFQSVWTVALCESGQPRWKGSLVRIPVPATFYFCSFFGIVALRIKKAHRPALPGAALNIGTLVPILLDFQNRLRSLNSIKSMLVFGKQWGRRWGFRAFCVKTTEFASRRLCFHFLESGEAKTWGRKWQSATYADWSSVRGPTTYFFPSATRLIAGKKAGNKG